MARYLFLLLSCFFFASAGAGEPVRIGVSGPFTGPSSPMGLSMLDGIRLAAREINAAGGVLGRPVELVVRDDEASNERGALVVQELINREGVVAGLGIVNTGVALASQRYYQAARVPVITSVATGTLVTQQFLPPEHPDNYVFRMSASDRIQADMIVEEAVERRRLRLVAIFHDATNYGVLGRDDLQRALAQRGLTAVVVERFRLQEKDMTPALMRARAAGAQVVLTYGIGPELAQIANGMARIDWRVPIIGSWTLGMSNFIDHAGPNAEGARMPQTFIVGANAPKARAFVENFRNLTASERIPVPPAAAQGYDSMLVLAAAIRQAGTTQGPGIRAALEDLRTPVEGAIKTYDRPFSREDHESLRGPQPPFIGEVRQGQVVFAYDGDRQRPPRP